MRSISRAGAGACTTVPAQARQASFGRLVTITRYCAGIIQPLGGVVADYRHRRLAAWARGVLRRQRHLDPRQVCRQRTAARAPLGFLSLGHHVAGHLEPGRLGGLTT
jgi:hypothetical protein